VNISRAAPPTRGASGNHPIARGWPAEGQPGTSQVGGSGVGIEFVLLAWLAIAVAALLIVSALGAASSHADRAERRQGGRRPTPASRHPEPSAPPERLRHRG